MMLPWDGEHAGANAPWPHGFDPLAALRRWPADVPALLLHSGRFHPRWARWSLLAAPAGVYRYLEVATPAGGPPVGRSVWAGPPGVVAAEAFTHRPFADLRRVVGATASAAESAERSRPWPETKGPGRGATAPLWIGYLSYDLGRWVEPRLTVSGGARRDRDWPIIELAYCPGYLWYDLSSGRWFAGGTWAGAGAPDWLRDLPQRSPAPMGNWPSAIGSHHAPCSDFTRPQYEAAVQRVLDYIAAGDAFQVNLAQRFTIPWAPRIASERGIPGAALPLAGRELFARLSTVSPAWYGAYLELGTAPARRILASTSPELFLGVTGDQVVTRPIKGTRPAGVDPAELRDSAKDAAELHMIVDLMRNDLGRVCRYGSVRVAEARAIESHPTIHHGVATITGRLHPAKDLADLLRAALPGGSVTGAPKLRAMQIIDQLEPVRRGPYCGAIGCLARRSASLNLAIRTLLLDEAARHSDFAVGGGIVADSRPEHEYAETLHKAAALTAALEQAALVL